LSLVNHNAHGISYVLADIGRCGAMALIVLSMDACASRSVEPTPVTAPEPQIDPIPAAPMKAAVIMQKLSDKSFKYALNGRTGTVTFNADGTFDYQETGKGKGTGVWQASDGALCEAFDPTSFLPQGTRSECQPFKVAGTTYFAGPARFDPM
jgi:hypothetical protein